MPYHLDFTKTTLEDFKKRLERTDLIPSMVPLMDGLETRLAALRKAGIASLEDLSRAVRDAKARAGLAAESGVDEGYLVLLRRMIEGFRPKPARLGEYPCIDSAVIAALADAGIRNSRELYEAASDVRTTAALAEKTGVPEKTIRELRSLADLSRIQWVSPTFARALYEAGYQNPSDIAAAKSEDVYAAVLRINGSGKYYRGKVGLRDMARLVQLAGELF